jgi:Fe-S cluster assembly iron-binding protein IscA
MITLSENASKELEAFFTAHDDVKKSIRIFFAPGG